MKLFAAVILSAVAVMLLAPEGFTQSNTVTPSNGLAGTENPAGLKSQEIDGMIAEDEKSVEIYGGKSPTALFQLGKSYRIKGDSLAQRNADGKLIPSPASREWYQKSASTLERAVVLDRESNQDNRNNELKRGRPPQDIPDIGNDKIYRDLGLAHARLGNHAKALEAYQYMRHLLPTHPDAYLGLSSAYIATGRQEDAAITLMQVLLLDSNQQDALQLLVDIYPGIDREGCAIIRVPNRPMPQLNAECGIVKTHLCKAYAGLVRIYIEAKQTAQAEQTRTIALTLYKCPPNDFATNAVPAAVETK